MSDPWILGVVVTDHPAFIAAIVAIPSALVGYLGYRQARKNDALAAQAGMATVAQGTISQVIDALNKHNANLQADNVVLRSTLDDVNARLAKVIAYCEELKQQLADLSKRLPQTDSI